MYCKKIINTHNSLFKPILALIFLAASLNGQSVLKIPKGKNILPNGIIEKTEWKEAIVLALDSEIKLLAKQDKQYFYLGIHFLKENHTGIDLYLADSISERRMLHISSALGEKKFGSSGWQDIIWNENKLWVGNSVGQILENNERKALAPGGFEFQINKVLFKEKIWFLRIHLKRPEKIYPKNSSDESISSWFRLRL